MKSRVICQAFAMPRKGLKKTLDEAQAQAEAEGQSFVNFYLCQPIFIILHCIFFSYFTLCLSF